jgi:hypothetical protein
MVQSGSTKEQLFLDLLDSSITLIEKFKKFDGVTFDTPTRGKIRCSNFLSVKPSLFGEDFLSQSEDFGLGLSQFAVKEEAAGKIRLFALLDSVTQSTLAPLHEMLFDLLKSIPNDGTFDQVASIKRSQTKAINANCAYSFDLTAATDRLPARLTSEIFSTIVQKEDFGKLWLSIMTDRNFWFNDKIANKLKVSVGPYKYAVGQPMGGLSSWAGLAITHHWIVQLASFKVYSNLNWNTDYEILGDDLVIFDKKLADQYLLIMQDLGCEINLNKSIVSHNRPVFEFAKRLCWGNQIVSGISLNQILAGNSIGSRITNVLAFAESGLLSSLSLLAITLSKYSFRKGKSITTRIFETGDSYKDKLLSLSVLGLLGSLVNKNIMSLESILAILINPKDKIKIIGNRTSVPIMQILNLLYRVLKESSSEVDCSDFISRFKSRMESYKALHHQFVESVVNDLMSRTNSLYSTYIEDVRKNSLNLVSTLKYVDPESKCYYEDAELEDLPEEIQELYSELHGLSFLIFNIEPDGRSIIQLMNDLHDLGIPDSGLELDDSMSIEEFEKQLLAGAFTKEKYAEVEFTTVLALQDRLEQLSFKINPPVHPEPGKFIMETAPAIVLAKREEQFRNSMWDHLGLNFRKTNLFSIDPITEEVDSDSRLESMSKPFDWDQLI